MAITVPNTTTVANHGLLIQVAGGQPVGCITGWDHQQSMELHPVFEFGSITQGGGDDIQGDSGEKVEDVPGNISGTTISIQRYDVYTKRFEDAFGTNNLVMLTRQLSSIRFIEYIASPNGDLDFRQVFYGCWFTNIGRTYKAEGDKRVLVNAQASYARKRLIS